MNEDAGEEALNVIANEFGPNKAIYVKTDVTNYAQFEGEQYVINITVDTILFTNKFQRLSKEQLKHSKMSTY